MERAPPEDGQPPGLKGRIDPQGASGRHLWLRAPRPISARRHPSGYEPRGGSHNEGTGLYTSSIWSGFSINSGRVPCSPTVDDFGTEHVRSVALRRESSITARQAKLLATEASAEESHPHTRRGSPASPVPEPETSQSKRHDSPPPWPNKLLGFVPVVIHRAGSNYQAMTGGLETGPFSRSTPRVDLIHRNRLGHCRRIRRLGGPCPARRGVNPYQGVISASPAMPSREERAPIRTLRPELDHGPRHPHRGDAGVDARGRGAGALSGGHAQGSAHAA